MPFHCGCAGRSIAVARRASRSAVLTFAPSRARISHVTFRISSLFAFWSHPSRLFANPTEIPAAGSHRELLGAEPPNSFSRSGCSSHALGSSGMLRWDLRVLLPAAILRGVGCSWVSACETSSASLTDRASCQRWFRQTWVWRLEHFFDTLRFHTSAEGRQLLKSSQLVMSSLPCQPGG